MPNFDGTVDNRWRPDFESSQRRVREEEQAGVVASRELSFVPARRRAFEPHDARTAALIRRSIELDRRVAAGNVHCPLPAGAEHADDRRRRPRRPAIAPTPGSASSRRGSPPPAPPRSGRRPPSSSSSSSTASATAATSPSRPAGPSPAPCRRSLTPPAARAGPPPALSPSGRQGQGAGSSSTLQAPASSRPVTVRAIAAIGARAFSRISSNSSSGSDCITIAPPAPIVVRPGRITIVRITIDEVDAAVEPEVADRPRVDAARLVLEVVDDLHRPLLRGAGHRAAGEAGADALDRGAARLRGGR